MTRFPQIDLPDEFPSDIELRLHDSAIFESLHTLGEKTNYFYAIAHKAITLAGEPSYDNPFLLKSLTVGVQAYEIIDTLVDQLAGDRQMYDDEKSMKAVNSGSMQFAVEIKRPEDFFARADYALKRMREDAPALTETVHEVVYRHVNHDKVGIEAALKGAAAMRSLQIHVDRKRAA